MECTIYQCIYIIQCLTKELTYTMPHIHLVAKLIYTVRYSRSVLVLDVSILTSNMPKRFTL